MSSYTGVLTQVECMLEIFNVLVNELTKSTDFCYTVLSCSEAIKKHEEETCEVTSKTSGSGKAPINSWLDW